MEGLSISSIWKILKWLPPFILRRIFTKQRLGELVLVDVRPRHEYATVNLGEVATFQIWLQLINLSPFMIELDRLELKFWCGGTMLKAYVIKKLKMSSGAVEEIYINENIPDGHANQIGQNVSNHQSSVEVHIEFNCTLHDFSKSTGQLNGVLPRFMNQQMRLRSELSN